jgi:ABC-type transport system involved in multi-copper enzyme maturation permease subunit
MSPNSPNSDLHPLEKAERQRLVLLRIIRLTFVVILATITLLTIYRGGGGETDLLVERWPITLAVAALFGALAIAIDVLTPEKKIATMFSILFGLLGALLVTAALGFIIDVLAESYNFAQAKEIVISAKLLIGICLAYLGITTVLQTQDDFRW